MSSHIKTIGIIAIDGQFVDLAGLGVKHEDVDIVAIFGREIHQPVSL